MRSKITASRGLYELYVFDGEKPGKPIAVWRSKEDALREIDRLEIATRAIQKEINFNKLEF